MFTAEDMKNPISHRVVSITNKGLIKTKGDNNPRVDNYRTTQKNVISKAVIFQNHPVVIKKIGALFIADFRTEGVLYKWGDRFTFLKNLSAAIKTWGFVITMIAILGYLFMMLGGRR
jgi:hypothetical protein